MQLSHTDEVWIWDLDGTLIDSYQVITASLVRVTEAMGHPVSFEEILREIKQGSMSVFVSHWVDRFSGDPEAFYALYREYTHGLDDTIPLIPGAAETLRGLRDAGARHFVYTHRGDSSFSILERNGILPLFEEVVTSLAGFPRKPAPDGVLYLLDKYKTDPERTFYVGDRELDVGCAVAAGVRAVLYREEGSFVLPTGAEYKVVSRLTDLL